MRQLTPPELKELDHIQKMIRRNTDNGIISNVIRIVIPTAKNEMWINILELAEAKSKEFNGSADTTGN